LERSKEHTKQKILLVGAGGHGRACADVIERHGGFQLVGFVDANLSRTQTVSGYPVLGGDDDLPALLKDIPCAMVGVGQIKSLSVNSCHFSPANDCCGQVKQGLVAIR